MGNQTSTAAGGQGGPALTLSPNVECLEISDRFLVHFPQELKQLKLLKILSLARNKITKLDGISNVASLEDLDLSYNALTILQDELFNCPVLIKLNLSFNQISQLPSSVQNAKLLQIFNLSNNIITAIPIDMGLVSNLTILNLSFNRLTVLPKEIGKLGKLSKLIINNNKLQSVPIEIGNLSSLVLLDLAENELRTLPQQIGNLKQLTKLYLDNNDFLEMISELGNLEKLKELNLRSNQLVDLPSSMNKLVNLVILDLDDNQWDSVEYTVNDIPRLLSYLKTKKDIVNKSRKSTSKEYRRTIQRQKVEDKKRLNINNVFEQTFQMVEYKKKLLQIKEIHGRMFVRKINFSPTMLNTSGAFILDCGKKIYIFMGTNVTPRESLKARHLAKLLNMENGGASEVLLVSYSIARRDELSALFNEFGQNTKVNLKPGNDIHIAQEIEDFFTFELKLFKFFEKEVGSIDIQVFVGEPLFKSFVDSTSCSVLDTGSDIYVWSGLYSTPNERSWAMLKAEELIVRKSADQAEILWVVDGMETLLFKEFFVDWPDLGWDAEFIKSQQQAMEQEEAARVEAENQKKKNGGRRTRRRKKKSSSFI